MRVLIIDNYDSFTYNLYQMVGGVLKRESPTFVLDVIRNDELSLSEIQAKNYDRIIISPGPGSPTDPAYFGVCGEVILQLGRTVPIFGVCLGMQGICYFFGGKVISAPAKLHGKTSNIIHNDEGVFKDIPQHVEVMRYHSLIVDPRNLPSDIVITALVEEKDKQYDLNYINKNRNTFGDIEIMGIRHTRFPIEGVQFHPESFATEAGEKLLQNYLHQNRHRN